MTELNIVFLDASTVGSTPSGDKIKTLGRCTFYDSTTPQQTAERIRNADIVITNKVRLTAALMEGCPTLKMICITATGTNNVDLDYAAKRGIPVKNVAGYSTESVVMCTFSMLLTLKTRPGYFDHYVKSGSYAQSPVFCHTGPSFTELHGKILGIIGLGTIGKRVAEVASAFGMQVVYHSPSGRPQPEAPYPHLSLPELLQAGDVVTIHSPLNEFTGGLIDYTALELMKKDALLLNAGRGGIVVEEDLCRALNDELIAGAGLDVFEREPLPADSPLLRLHQPEKLLLMPHVAWSSAEARERLMHTVYEYIAAFQ